MTAEALARIEKIVKAIEKTGYDPVEQLYGYYLTGRTAYITRRENARMEILLVDARDLEEYLEERIPK